MSPSGTKRTKWMWILPKTHPLYCLYARGTGDSKSVLSECLEASESSLMWRSKPSLLRTWLTRWKRGGWFRHLSGRILSPSDQKSFEGMLTSLPAATPVSRFPLRVNARGRTTLDISFPTLSTLLKGFDLDSASLRTWKDISALDSEKSLKVWKKLVTQQRGEYSVRLKSGHPTREKGCLSWPTASVSDTRDGTVIRKLTVESAKKKALRGISLNHSVESPVVKEILERAAMNWPTPTFGGNNGGSIQEWGGSGNHLRDGPLDPEKNNMNGKSRESWATPRTITGGAESAKRKQELGRTASGGGDLQSQAGAKLNANWVEQLMGLETGWTALDYAAME